MTGLLVCAALSLGIFALAALADERWPERLSRRGHALRGEAWQGQWGPRPAYTRVSRGHAGSAVVAPTAH